MFEVKIICPNSEYRFNLVKLRKINIWYKWWLTLSIHLINDFIHFILLICKSLNNTYANSHPGFRGGARGYELVFGGLNLSGCNCLDNFIKIIRPWAYSKNVFFQLLQRTHKSSPRWVERY
jgi:hypothetical protein